MCSFAKHSPHWLGFPQTKLYSSPKRSSCGRVFKARVAPQLTHYGAVCRLAVNRDQVASQSLALCLEIRPGVRTDHLNYNAVTLTGICIPFRHVWGRTRLTRRHFPASATYVQAGGQLFAGALPVGGTLQIYGFVVSHDRLYQVPSCMSIIVQYESRFVGCPVRE